MIRISSLEIIIPLVDDINGLQCQLGMFSYDTDAPAWARGYIFFMLNSAEHEILVAYKYNSIKKISLLQALVNLEYYFLR